MQFLQGKSTQAEFCHTLNALIDAGRQVVIAADRPPNELENLDERVRSRLAGGVAWSRWARSARSYGLEILKTKRHAAAQLQYHPSFDVAGAGARPISPSRSPTTDAIWKAR